jgi:hypothetical protein
MRTDNSTQGTWRTCAHDLPVRIVGSSVTAVLLAGLLQGPRSLPMAILRPIP